MSMKFIYILILISSYSICSFGTEDKKLAKMPESIELASNGDSYLYKVVQQVGKLAFGKYNIKFSQKIYPHARGLILANDGRIDGGAARVFDLHKKTKDEFSNLLRVDESFMTIYWTAFVQEKNKDIKIEGWRDLKKYRVASLIGNKTMETRLRKFVLKENIFSVGSYEQAFGMLQRGRLDVVVGKPSVGIPFLKNNTHFLMKGKFENADLYMYLHKKHKGIIPSIEAELKKLKVDGTLDKINEKVLAELMK